MIKAWITYSQVTLKGQIPNRSQKFCGDKPAQYLDGWLLKNSRYCLQPMC